MKRTSITIIIFGFLLAVLALVLHFFEYRYIIGSLNKNIYTAAVATIFTAAGIWIGLNIINKKKVTNIESEIADNRKKEELKLNDREYEILLLIAKGLSNKEIADKLFLAIPTIKTHTSNLYTKLDVKSRTQAVHKAKSINLIAH